MLAEWFLLVPILYPLIGAILFALIASKSPMRLRLWLAQLFIVIEIILIAINAAPGLHRVTVSDWSLAAFSITLQMDGVTWLLLLVMFVPLASIWLIAPPQKPFDLSAIFILTSALALTCAANWIAAYIAMTLLDLAILIWRLARTVERETAWRGLAIGLLSGLILFGGALLVASKQADTGAVLIALALWARLGLFPFHFLLPTRGTESFGLWLARGIPLIAACNLWLHWSLFGVNAPITLIGILTLSALIAAMIWIARATNLDPANKNSDLFFRAASTSAQAAFALIPLTVTLGNQAGVALGLWLTLAAVFALAFFEMAYRWRADNLNRYARLLWFAAIFSLAALPLTPAFLGRLGLFVAMWETNNAIVMVLAGIATLITLAPMWNIGLMLSSAEVREPTRTEYLGLAIMVLAGLGLSFLPWLITRALGSVAADSYERAIDLNIRTNDALGVTLGIVILIAPVIGSYFLGASWRRLRPRSGAFIFRLGDLIDLAWLENWIVKIGLSITNMLRGVIAIAEENPTVWILFIALWVAIFIQLAR